MRAAALAVAVVGCAEPAGTGASRVVGGDAGGDAGVVARADAGVVARADAGVVARVDAVAGDASLPNAPRVDRPFRGRFVRDTDLEARIAALEGWGPWTNTPREVSSVFASDLDGDGREELVLGANLDLLSPVQRRARSWIARGDGAGRWSITPNPPSVGACRFASDLDGDGARDLFCVGEQGRVLWSDRGRFDAGRATVLDVGDVGMAAMAWDLDDDGLPEIVVSNWQRGPLRVFHNLGARRFEEVAARWGLVADGLTWCGIAVDFDGDGRDDLLFVGDGDNHENRAFRALGPGPDGAPRFERVRPTTDPMVAAAWFGTTNIGPMGAAVTWLDADDRVDLVLASDYHSGPGLPILSDLTPGDWRPVSARYDLSREVTDTGMPLIPWSPRPWDIDHDGWQDLLVPNGDDLGHGMTPGRGVSRVLFFQHRADGRLRDVADAVLPTRGQFMTPSLVDLDGDGDLDLILGGFGQSLQVFRNEVEGVNPHALLRLVGRAATHDALGAHVTVRAAGTSQRFIYGGIAAPQATELSPLDVALGAGGAEFITVRWPSGYVQELRNVPRASVIGLVEPEIITIDPPSRHAAADGSATVTVTVRPVDAVGGPRAASVSIEAPSQTAASWTGPAETLPDGRVRRSLRAPAAPGSAVVVVSIDGAALRVRPRVWFD